MTTAPTDTKTLHNSTIINSTENGSLIFSPNSVVVMMLSKEPAMPATRYIPYSVSHAPKYKLTISPGRNPTILVIKQAKKGFVF